MRAPFSWEPPTLSFRIKIYVGNKTSARRLGIIDIGNATGRMVHFLSTKDGTEIARTSRKFNF
jgi:hypothetical protein